MRLPLLFCLTALNSIKNGDFEAKPPKDGSIPGWFLSVGATNGGSAPLSTVEMDSQVRKGGRQSLRFSGNGRTRAWRIAKQEVPARPGARYRLRAFAKTENVRKEKVEGTEITQFANCYVGLILFDGSGEVVARDYAHAETPSSGWKKLECSLQAPEAVRKAQVYIFLSMSGDFWVDAVELEIEGGKEPPKPKVLLREGFEKAARLPPEWAEEEGATNGSGSTRSIVEVDRQTGAPGSPVSLRLAGNGNTIHWYALRRYFPCSPGDVLRFRAMVKAENVRKEGGQFSNLHIHLFFKDREGKDVGGPRFAHPGDGTFDWKETVVEAAAPEGAARFGAGFFLSMSGEAWFDQIELTRQEGGTPAYHGWQSLETKHLLLRFPADHPFARDKRMKEYGGRLDEACERICRLLEVEFPTRITAFLYKDSEQGKLLTGQDLDFAVPDGSAFHQGPQSTLSHEMAHCIIHQRLGRGEMVALGEGIAVYLNGASPEDHRRSGAQLLRQGKLPKLADLFSEFRQLDLGYPAAGSFCGFVIETYGMDAFKRILFLDDPDAVLARLNGTIESVEAKWHEFLKGRP